MKPRNIAIIALMLVFFAAVAYALLREVAREETKLAGSLSGVVEVDANLYAAGQADIVKTDRLVLYLVDPATRRPVALNILSPLVPPQVFRVGQDDAVQETALEGAYLLVGITDKDGEIFKVTPGEVYGRSEVPIALGSEQVRLVLNQPFGGGLFNEGAPAAGPGGAAQQAGGAAEAIRGVVRVVDSLRAGVAPSDRLVILLMDPRLGRPVATKIIPHLLLPQAFTIAPPAGSTAKAYHLRILTDKDGDPVNAVQGEVIGRSKTPIAIGTRDLEFILDTPYRR